MRGLILAAVIGSACFCPAPISAQDPTGPALRALGFGDVSYRYGDGSRREGFVVGQVVGQLTAALSPGLNVFSELSATSGQTGYALDVERLIVRYDFSDRFKVGAGRFHTPISYWNTAFHHGLWLQTSVDRPEMIRFGSRLLPVHFVGAQAEGTVLPATAALSYSVGVGNGRASNIARAGDAGDGNDHPAYSASLLARPPSIRGLQVGVSFYGDRISADSVPDVRERIVSAHAAWIHRTPELIGEVARIWHAESGDPFVKSTAYYLQIAYPLPGRADRLKPYVRHERTEVGAADPVFAPLQLDYDAWVAGTRIEVAPLAALKLEYRRERFAEADWMDLLVAQVSLAVTGGGS